MSKANMEGSKGMGVLGMVAIGLLIWYLMGRSGNVPDPAFQVGQRVNIGGIDYDAIVRRTYIASSKLWSYDNIQYIPQHWYWLSGLEGAEHYPIPEQWLQQFN